MGAQHLRVPYGLIRQLCYGGGTRLEPRVRKVRPPEPEELVESTWTPSTSGYVAPGIPSTPFELARKAELARNRAVEILGPELVTEIMGNLKNESYRFFKGSSVKDSPYFQCRGCLAEEYMAVRKLYHMRECRPLIQEIESRARRDKCCLICNTHTKKDKWNVPLCSEACITKWRFAMPEPWLASRRLVLAIDPKLLRTPCVFIAKSS